MNHPFSKLPVIILSVAIATTLGINWNSKAIAFSVCGLTREAATFKTKSYLVTICIGEASYQLIMTYHDGTGYKRLPVVREGKKYRGSEGKNNYIIDGQVFIIGTDGEPPIRETVIQSR